MVIRTGLGTGKTHSCIKLAAMKAKVSLHVEKRHLNWYGHLRRMFPERCRLRFSKCIPLEDQKFARGTMCPFWSGDALMSIRMTHGEKVCLCSLHLLVTVLMFGIIFVAFSKKPSSFT